VRGPPSSRNVAAAEPRRMLKSLTLDTRNMTRNILFWLRIGIFMAHGNNHMKNKLLGIYKPTYYLKLKFLVNNFEVWYF
jgi:hypothetical protein